MEKGHIYDTLILGSGYFSVGFSLSRKNCIICEENQICDTSFYLPLSSFEYKEYLPKTSAGKRLFEIFSELSLFSCGMQNANAFECGFCKFLLENPSDILLKCRVISIEKEDEFYCATVQTNEGLSRIYAESILDTRAEGDAHFTTLFFTKEYEKDRKILSETFPFSYTEKAFYEDRYALHIPVGEYDENTIKVAVYNKWRTLDTNAKIVYMSPMFSKKSDKEYCDAFYENPIEAFEAGYFYAEGDNA